MTWTDDEIADAARRSCKAQGCLCRVDLVVTRPDPDEPLFFHVKARHDNWCPLALARNRKAS
jgi:hypothetical protein